MLNENGGVKLPTDNVFKQTKLVMVIKRTVNNVYIMFSLYLQTGNYKIQA